MPFRTPAQPVKIKLNNIKPVTLLIIRCSISFGQNIKNFSEWTKTLHFSSDNTKEVIDQDFYLTNSPIIKDEILEFKRIINSDSGHLLACQFPARYLLLRKTFLDTKSYKLSECRELSIFVGGFKKRHVSLMITSEVLNAPASAFGHLLLLFHDKDIPELSSDVIHFSAISDDKDGFFSYVYKGLTGVMKKLFIYSAKDSNIKFSHQLIEIITNGRKFPISFNINFRNSSR